MKKEAKKVEKEIKESTMKMSITLPRLEPSMFISTGSTELNLALSGIPNGGWRKGRVVNVVGDKSTGKTLLAIEAITYTLRVLGKEQRVKVIYDETESAFDIPYAEMLGMPVDDVDFRQSSTVEEFYTNLDTLLEDDDYDFLFYVLDSLDALSSKREEATKIDEGSYPSKPAKMSELFRRLVNKVQHRNAIIMIISQIRDNIGVTFGRKSKRAGGKAMDFYMSQVVWLAEKKKLTRANRVIGVDIKAKVDKNKVWKPYREATFPILFEYGIDDVGSMVDFLVDNGIGGQC